MAKIICINPWLVISFFVILANIVPHSAEYAPQAIFVLGDSTADVGTNTFLPNASNRVKANFPRYGVDFPNHRATGRFSNGLNTADFIAKWFGLDRSPPPFEYLLNLKGNHFRKHLLRGVNFASAGAGLLDKTGSGFGVNPMSKQICQFSSVRENLTAILGSKKAESMIRSSLYFISVGSNDVFDYFEINRTMSEDQFIGALISAYSTYIHRLYKLGARKFGIISMPPIGCIPFQRLVQKLVHGTDGCLDEMNDYATAFHKALESLLLNLSSHLPEFKYSLGNTFQMTMDVVTKGEFKVVDTACCGMGVLNAEFPCNGTASLCPDRRQYLFWDAFHPTQAAAQVAANILYGGPTIYVSPINFSQLAQQ